jgi:hypothetical protein
MAENGQRGLQFEWDTDKAQANVRDHGVTFEEAQTVFGDPLSLTWPDPDHSVGEERLIDLGWSAHGRLLLVVYTERHGRIRIISCRAATRQERRRYEEG